MLMKRAFEIFLVSLCTLFVGVTQTDAQTRTVQGPIECHSAEAASATREGSRYTDQGDHGRALAAYLQAVNAEPNCAATYNNLGTAYRMLERHTEAIEAYRKALSFNPSWGWLCHMNIGRSYYELENYKNAIAAYSKGLELKPKEAFAYSIRARLYLMSGLGKEAASDSEAYLQLEGWKKRTSPYVALMGYFGHVQNKNTPAAEKLLSTLRLKKTISKWPAPILSYLANEITEADLLSKASDTEKMTEARTYVGLNHLYAGKTDLARKHFEWVRDNGKKTFTGYRLAVSQLSH